MEASEFIDRERGTFTDPSLGMVLRNSAEHPAVYITKCGQWLYHEARPHFTKRYYRNQQFNYLKCCGTRYYIHRLVEFAWVFNPCPLAFKCVDHMDHDTQNKCAENLRWCTQQLNCLNRKQTFGVQKIVRSNGAVYYRSRCTVGGKRHNAYFRTRDGAVRGSRCTRNLNFDRV